MDYWSLVLVLLDMVIGCIDPIEKTHVGRHTRIRIGSHGNFGQGTHVGSRVGIHRGTYVGTCAMDCMTT